MKTDPPVPSAASHPGLRPSAPGEYLAFHLRAEQYSMDILGVQEIRSYERPTRSADAPDFIKGVIDLPGRIVPLLDLRMKLRCAEVAYNEFTAVIRALLSPDEIGLVESTVAA